MSVGGETSRLARLAARAVNALPVQAVVQQVLPRIGLLPDFLCP
jgi:hypothetical protein